MIFNPLWRGRPLFYIPPAALSWLSGYQPDINQAQRSVTLQVDLKLTFPSGKVDRVNEAKVTVWCSIMQFGVWYCVTLAEHYTLGSVLREVWYWITWKLDKCISIPLSSNANTNTSIGIGLYRIRMSTTVDPEFQPDVQPRIAEILNLIGFSNCWREAEDETLGLCWHNPAWWASNVEQHRCKYNHKYKYKHCAIQSNYLK